MGQYISIEKAIAETKDDAYAALARADRWHEEENDPTFIKYMLAVILALLSSCEQQVDLVVRTSA